MSETAGNIPVVSVAPIAADVAEANIKEEEWRHVGEELIRAFTDTGFCFVKDHGVDKSLLDEGMKVNKEFFQLPLEVKKRRLRGDVVREVFGWMPKPNTEGIDIMPETFDLSKPPDYKETYNLSNYLDESLYPTDDEVPGFRATTFQLIKTMELLSERCLIALGYGLKLKDPLALCKLATKMGTSKNFSAIRYAFYPRVPPEEIKDGLLRCGEHTDFSYLSFLVNNGVSGLQIKTRNGEYVSVPTQEDALGVNIADSLERVTGGILRSTPHRVNITEQNSTEDRYSFIYYRFPDNDVHLDPVCGEKEKYEKQVLTQDFIFRRIGDVFIRGAGIVQHSTSN